MGQKFSYDNVNLYIQDSDQDLGVDLYKTGSQITVKTKGTQVVDCFHISISKARRFEYYGREAQCESGGGVDCYLAEDRDFTSAFPTSNITQEGGGFNVDGNGKQLLRWAGYTTNRTPAYAWTYIDRDAFTVGKKNINVLLHKNVGGVYKSITELNVGILYPKLLPGWNGESNSFSASGSLRDLWTLPQDSTPGGPWNTVHRGLHWSEELGKFYVPIYRFCTSSNLLAPHLNFARPGNNKADGAEDYILLVAPDGSHELKTFSAKQFTNADADAHDFYSTIPAPDRYEAMKITPRTIYSAACQEEWCSFEEAGQVYIMEPKTGNMYCMTDGSTEIEQQKVSGVFQSGSWFDSTFTGTFYLNESTWDPAVDGPTKFNMRMGHMSFVFKNTAGSLIKTVVPAAAAAHDNFRYLKATFSQLKNASPMPVAGFLPSTYGTYASGSYLGRQVLAANYNPGTVHDIDVHAAITAKYPNITNPRTFYLRRRNNIVSYDYRLGLRDGGSFTNNQQSYARNLKGADGNILILAMTEFSEVFTNGYKGRYMIVAIDTDANTVVDVLQLSGWGNGFRNDLYYQSALLETNVDNEVILAISPQWDRSTSGGFTGNLSIVRKIVFSGGVLSEEVKDYNSQSSQFMTAPDHFAASMTSARNGYLVAPSWGTYFGGSHGYNYYDYNSGQQYLEWTVHRATVPPSQKPLDELPALYSSKYRNNTSGDVNDLAKFETFHTARWSPPTGDTEGDEVTFPILLSRVWKYSVGGTAGEGELVERNAKFKLIGNEPTTAMIDDTGDGASADLPKGWQATESFGREIVSLSPGCILQGPGMIYKLERIR